MLGRYKIYRGQRPKTDPPPAGIRQDTRKHRERHCLHPAAIDVRAYLDNPTNDNWLAFKKKYLKLLEDRLKKDPRRFEDLAALAIREHVYIGCNCPTTKNPNVERCHTVLALEFMKLKFPKLKIVFPKT